MGQSTLGGFTSSLFSAKVAILMVFRLYSLSRLTGFSSSLWRVRQWRRQGSTIRSIMQKGMFSHSYGCSCCFSSGCFKASRYSLLISYRISPWSCRCWMRRCCSLNHPLSQSRVAIWSQRESICARSDSMEWSFWKESISQESLTCCLSTRLLYSVSWNFKNLKLSLSRMKGLEVSDTFSRNGCGLLYSTSRLQYSRDFYITYVFVGGTYIQFYSIKLHYRHYHHRPSPNQPYTRATSPHHGMSQCTTLIDDGRAVVAVSIYDKGSEGLYVRLIMSLTERSQIFKKWKPQSEAESISTFTSTSKRKGISLSKTLQQNEQRPQSFIKLSARQKNNLSTGRRSIKLIVKQRPESQHAQLADKENQMQNANQIIFGKDCELEQIMGNGKRQWAQTKATHNHARARQQLPTRQSHTIMPNTKMLQLRL